MRIFPFVFERTLLELSLCSSWLVFLLSEIVVESDDSLTGETAEDVRPSNSCPIATLLIFLLISYFFYIFTPNCLLKLDFSQRVSRIPAVSIFGLSFCFTILIKSLIIVKPWNGSTSAKRGITTRLEAVEHSRVRSPNDGGQSMENVVIVL